MNIHSLEPRNPRIYVHVFPFVNQAIDIYYIMPVLYKFVNLGIIIINY